MSNFNWGGAAGGAGSGAATGAMIGSVVPGLGTGVGALVGAGIGGLGGGLFGGNNTREVMPQLINPEEYQQALSTAQGAYNSNNEYMQNLMGQASGYRGQGSGFLQAYMNQDPASYNYDPMRAQNAFIAGAPQLQQLARSTVSDGSTDDLLRQERENIMQQVGDSFGGNPMSGAFAQSASQALASPLLQRSQAREQQISNLAGNLMGQSQGLLNQNFQRQADVDFQSQMMDRQRQLEAAQYMASLGGQAQQGAGTYANLAGQGLNMIGQLGQPVYATPDYVSQPSPWQQFMTGASQGTQLGANLAMLTGGFGGPQGQQTAPPEQPTQNTQQNPFQSGPYSPFFGG